MFSDIADLLTERLWLVIGFVVAVSVLLLAMVFRSVLVPLKAAVMNLLSIGAAYGVMVAVFQWGWGVELLGLDHADAGLQLGADPDVRDPVRALDGLRGLPALPGPRGLAGHRRRARQRRPRAVRHRPGDLQSAAAIMVAVFLGFASEVDVVVKMLGLGMAVAIFLDATVVRMVLVPATMSLLGRWNWWVPGWLDRVLPTIDVEGSDLDTPVAAPVAPTPTTTRSWPRPGADPTHSERNPR